jgi:hypothetical protein
LEKFTDASYAIQVCRKTSQALIIRASLKIDVTIVVPTSANAPHALNVKEASSSSELLDICRLRYEIYVSEMGRPQQFANHSAQTILEPMDEGSIVYAFVDQGDQIQGTIRETCALSPVAEKYRSLYGISGFNEEYLSSTFIGTKFMMRRAFRNFPSVVSVLRQVFARADAKGIRRVLLDVNEEKSALYRRLGFKSFGAGILTHPEYGRVHLMCLELADFPLAVGKATPSQAV